MTCVYGGKVCTGCMYCQEPKVIMKSDDGEEIYDGDVYYDIGGMIITPDELTQYRKVAGENDG